MVCFIAGLYDRLMEITLNELEEAINYWRIRCPARGEQCALSAEVNTLATVYATMIFERQSVLTQSFRSALTVSVPEPQDTVSCLVSRTLVRSP